jgi:hypothetical protein
MSCKRLVSLHGDQCRRRSDGDEEDEQHGGECQECEYCTRQSQVTF